MFQVWQDIDHVEAEATLRGLRRRRAELEEAVENQQQLLRLRPASFSLQLGLEAFFERRRLLEEAEASILIHRVAEPVKIILDGPEFSGHSANLGDLGTVLVRLQRAFSSVAQAITTGPTLRGPIAREITQGTQLRLAATFPSSFGMQVYVPTARDLYGHSLAAESLQQFFMVLTSLGSEQGVMQVTGEIGRRAFVHLSTLASLLRSRDSELRVEWRDHAGTQLEWSMGPEGAEQFLKNLKNVTETRSETIELRGRLVGASLLRRRFELIDSGGRVIDGKYITGLNPKIEMNFGKEVSVFVDETEVIDRSSNTTSLYYTLLAIPD